MKVLSTKLKLVNPLDASCSSHAAMASGECLRRARPSMALVEQIAAIQGTAAAALDRNPELGLAANGGNPEPGLREREIVQIACEGSVSRPLAGKVEARQSGHRRALRHAFEQGREGCFSFPLNSHVGPEVAQGALGENAITRPAHDNRSIAQAAAGLYDFTNRRQEELRIGHVLVIDIAHRNADDFRPESFDAILDGRLRVSLKHQIQQNHIVAGFAAGGGHQRRPQRQREDVHPLNVRGDEKNPHNVVQGTAAPRLPHPADEGSTTSIPSGARMAPLCHFAQFLDLTLNALTFLPTRSPSPLIEGLEDTHHPMKRDGDKELVSGKAS